MSAAHDIRIFDDPQRLFQGAAEEFASQATAAVRSRGRFTVALSGGSTPRSLYSLLAQNRSLPWDKIYFFFGDERHVPPDSPESNYRMVRESLLSKVPSPAANVFRIPAENPEASEAAKAYEQTLKQFFNMHCPKTRQRSLRPTHRQKPLKTNLFPLRPPSLRKPGFGCTRLLSRRPPCSFADSGKRHGCLRARTAGTWPWELRWSCS